MEPVIPEAFQGWLVQTADVLDECRSAFAETPGGWSPAQGSHAQWEWDQAESVGWAEPLAQVHVVLMDWIEAADAHVGALAAVVRAGEVTHSVPYLVRGVVEHCHKVMWLLEADHEAQRDGGPVTTGERAARAYLEELYSLQHRREAVKKMSGKGSADFRHCDGALVEMRSVTIPNLFGPIPGETAALDDRDPSKWRIAGQRWMGPTALAERYGRRRLGGHAFDGTYDALSDYSHPTLYAHREFVEYIPAEGGVIRRRNIPQSFLRRVIAGGAVTYWRAGMDLASYFGWPMAALDRCMHRLNHWSPGSIAEDPTLRADSVPGD